MPAVFTPPPLRRGNRKFNPDPEAISEFIKLLKPGAWVSGDEGVETYAEINRISTVYRNDLAATGKLPEPVKARHFATDAEGTIIADAPKDGAEGIVWRFGLALQSTT